MRNIQQDLNKTMRLNSVEKPYKSRGYFVQVTLALSLVMIPSAAMAKPGLEKLLGFVTMAGDAVGSLADGIEKAFNSGARIYDNLSLREEEQRLLNLSANLSHLGMSARWQRS
ncbi:MAG: hypothetical protein GKS05_09325 [Nitrospirales bacterium]|nr:hypothetical protein [Nitrospirales bacterium]